MQDRLNHLNDAQGAWYLNQILVGVQQRGTGLKSIAIPGSDSRHGRGSCAWSGCYVFNELEPCDFWIYDLVMAAGGHDTDVAWDEFGIYLTEQGLHLLEQVWIGDYENPSPVLFSGINRGRSLPVLTQLSHSSSLGQVCCVD